MSSDLHDTIVALSSAPGTGARAIIRLSGPEALPIVLRRFIPDEAIPAQQRALVHGGIRLPGLSSPLPASVYYWPAPRTYTGQELAEVHTISNPPLVGLLLAELIQAGARAARPGEFTLRAFLAGKMDLTRAEAVLAVIHASDRDELKAALAQLAGGMARPLQALRNDLLNLLADVEAGLDFLEEDVRFLGSRELLDRLAAALAVVTIASKQLTGRCITREPFRVVLVGPPNAGKSSLFNSLCGRPAALVSPEPGTTRDYVTRTLELDGAAVELVDTAGWREASDPIETQAQDLSRDQAGRADLMLVCRPPGEAAWADSSAAGPARLEVGTKADLGPHPGWLLATSARTGAGIDLLRQVLAERAAAHARPTLAASTGRCRTHLNACLEHLRHAHGAVLFEEPPEILALEVRQALDELGELVGTVYTDDLLDRIFSRFCIGK